MLEIFRHIFQIAHHADLLERTGVAAELAVATAIALVPQKQGVLAVDALVQLAPSACIAINGAALVEQLTSSNAQLRDGALGVHCELVPEVRMRRDLGGRAFRRRDAVEAAAGRQRVAVRDLESAHALGLHPRSFPLCGPAVPWGPAGDSSRFLRLRHQLISPFRGSVR